MSIKNSELTISNNFKLPDNLKKLGDLATNFWFSWNPDARDLFREIDLELWRTNPATGEWDIFKRDYIQIIAD